MAKDSPSRSLNQFMLRLPDGMRERLAARAKINERSMNAEAIAILGAALGGDEHARYREISMALREAEAAHTAMRETMNENRRRMDALRAARRVVRREIAILEGEDLPELENTGLIDPPHGEEA